ncbi:MAG: hypothetical protein P4N41_18615, partial [Negativicutes bacterium]|nr:hypothetical protein [Negativicutes bacterium]
EGINFNFQIPPHIIIAIPHADRMRDLTPTHHKDFATSGGGPDFLRFQEKELVPHIDASYRTGPPHDPFNEERQLMGAAKNRTEQPGGSQATWRPACA